MTKSEEMCLATVEALKIKSEFEKILTTIKWAAEKGKNCVKLSVRDKYTGLNKFLSSSQIESLCDMLKSEGFKVSFVDELHTEEIDSGFSVDRFSSYETQLVIEW
jgi:hypothetical protein